MNPAFDTLTALRSLEASGLDSTHAEAIVQVVSQTHEQLATKSDIAGLKDESNAFQSETRAGFAALRNEMQEGFAALRLDLAQEMSNRFAASKAELEDGLAALRLELRQEMSNGFATSRSEREDGLAALRQELKQEMSDGFATSKSEREDGLAVWKREIESSFALQTERFQTSLSQTVNRMLVAQVAVGGLVIAVLMPL